MWKQQLLDQSFLLEGLLLIRSLISEQHSCILVSQSTPKATCLVITRLLWTMQALHYQCNPRDHFSAYHQVWEAIAAGYLLISWKDGKSNHTDIWSKHWGFSTIWPLLHPLLSWHGGTWYQINRE